MSSTTLQSQLQVAQRVHAIEPFRVMEMVKAAAELKRAGHDIISMSVGEPDFTAPDIVANAAMEAIRSGTTALLEDGADLARHAGAMADTGLRVLLTERNQRWAGWVKQRLGKPGTVFVAVGAGHLAGPESVQAQLKRLGVKAERVKY